MEYCRSQLLLQFPPTYAYIFFVQVYPHFVTYSLRFFIPFNIIVRRHQSCFWIYLAIYWLLTCLHSLESGTFWSEGWWCNSRTTKSVVCGDRTVTAPLYFAKAERPIYLTSLQSFMARVQWLSVRFVWVYLSEGVMHTCRSVCLSLSTILINNL